MNNDPLLKFRPVIMKVFQDVDCFDNMSTNCENVFFSYDQLLSIIENLGMISFIRKTNNNDDKFELTRDELKQFLSLLHIDVSPNVDVKCNDCKFNNYLNCYKPCEVTPIYDDEDEHYHESI